MKPSQLAILCLAFIVPLAFAQAPADNSNLWPVHRDGQTRFRISYPPGWIIVPTKGRNVRFSVNPPAGPGNCNVVARPNAELNGMTQPALNSEIESLLTDQNSWAEYIGLPPSQVHVIETRHARIHDVPVLFGVVETTLQNLEGKFTRKQIVALTFTPGLIWSLNCGASTFKADDARSRFAELRPTFNKVFGSFGFLR
ncbi:MAG: hypothetical protein V4454_11785 [Pseudomonadota bacterium]